MLRDTTVVVVVAAAVVRTRPRAIPLAKIAMRKSTHEFPLMFIYGMLMELRYEIIHICTAVIDVNKE